MEHVLRKPVESSRAYAQRRKAIVGGVILAIGVALALAVLMVGEQAGTVVFAVRPAHPQHRPGCQRVAALSQRARLWLVRNSRMNVSLFGLATQFSQCPGIFLKRFAIGFVVNELAFSAAFDEVRLWQDSKVVRNGGGCHPAQRHNLSTVHFITGRDGFKNEDAGFVRESLGDAFDRLPVHRYDEFNGCDAAAPAVWGTPGKIA
jgi:hypothetical protein